MKRLSFVTCLTTLLSFLAAVTVFPQRPADKPIKQCDAMIGRQLIDQQVDFSQSLDLADQRVNVLVKVADLLWKADEDAARRYLTEAFKVAVTDFRETDKAHQQGPIQREDLRYLVIRAVAKHDGEWARRLTDSILADIEKEKEDKTSETIPSQEEIQKVLNVAASVAGDNPQLAALLAGRVMKYPVTVGWFFALYEMARTNPRLAESLYSQVLTAHPNDEVFRLLYLSAFPFGRERVFGIERYSLGINVPEGFTPSDTLQRQFLTTLFRRILKLTPENTEQSLQTSTPQTAATLIALNEIEPFVAQRFSNLQPLFYQARAHAQSLVSNEMMDAAGKTSDFGSGFNRSFADKLKEVEEADEKGRLNDLMIIQLLLAAAKEEDFKAAEGWLDKIRDGGAKDGAVDNFLYRRSLLASKEERFDDARRFADKVSRLENRAALYFEIAEAKLKEEDFKAAEEWLDKIRDGGAKDGAIDNFFYRRSLLASKEERFEDARRFADKVSRLENRAALYFEVAEAKLKEETTRYESLDTLLDVYKMAAKAPDSVEKAQVLMGLAFIYERVSHSDALDAMSLAVKTANAVERSDLFTSVRLQEIRGKDFTHYAVYSIPGFDLDRTFYEISKKDFQGALSRAEGFSDRYLRALAVIATVRDCEKNTPNIKPRNR